MEHLRAYKWMLLKHFIWLNRSRAQNDLDNGPVAKIIGHDSRGHVRGLSMGVSKTSFRHFTPYMRTLGDELSSHEKLKTKMTQLIEEAGGLQKELDELKPTPSQGGTRMLSPTHCGSSSQAQNNFPRQEARMDNVSVQTVWTRLIHLMLKDVWQE